MCKLHGLIYACGHNHYVRLSTCLGNYTQSKRRRLFRLCRKHDPLHRRLSIECGACFARSRSLADERKRHAAVDRVLTTLREPKLDEDKRKGQRSLRRTFRKVATKVLDILRSRTLTGDDECEHDSRERAVAGAQEELFELLRKQASAQLEMLPFMRRQRPEKVANAVMPRRLRSRGSLLKFEVNREDVA